MLRRLQMMFIFNNYTNEICQLIISFEMEVNKSSFPKLKENGKLESRFNLRFER